MPGTLLSSGNTNIDRGRGKEGGRQRAGGHRVTYSGPSRGHVQKHSGQKRARDVSAGPNLHISLRSHRHRVSAYLEENTKNKTK